MVMPSPVTDGGCFCGAVRYRLTGPPTASMICHCQSCCRAAGSPAVAWLTVAADDFSLVRGSPCEFHSSRQVTRTLCASCGTPLTYTHADRPGEIDVTTCSLDDPAAFPPTYHSWTSHSPAWLRFGDDLPVYERSNP